MPSTHRDMSESNQSLLGWSPGTDFRIICPCQLHGQQEGTLWRRSARMAASARTGLKDRGVALLVGLPLAFLALGFPTEAMNLVTRTAPPALVVRPEPVQVQPEAAAVENRALPIFTSSEIAQEFLVSQPTRHTFTLESAKEEFFNGHVPYGSIIYREARRHNLQPELVAAVVATESDFRPRLVSHKNAMGLMQLVPNTGKLMGAEDLFNPAQNIAAGTRYLRYLYNRFGDQRIALAAYNAGEGNVERWGGIPPFEETQNYLQRVNARTRSYRERIRGTYLTSVRLQLPH